METTDMDELITLNEYKKMKMISKDLVKNINNSCVFKKSFNVPVADPQDIDTDFSTSASRVQVNSVKLNESQATLSLPPKNMVFHEGFWQEQSGKNCGEEQSQLKNLVNPIIITYWSPMLLINNKLAFVGISPSNCMVKFSNIQERLSRCKMSDRKGIVYLLYGPMYPKKDLPQYIRMKFTLGIPENWKKLCSLWGCYLDMGCPKDFCWSDANTSVVTETDFIEKKPGRMNPLPLNGSFNCINPSITNSCSMDNASTETSSTKSYTSIMLEKKIAKLQAMLRTTLQCESMCSQHPDDSIAELIEHRNNGSQHPNPRQHKNNEQHVDSVPCSGDTLIIQNVQALKRTNEKNNQGPITSVRCSTQLKKKRLKVHTKNMIAKKNNKLQPFIGENTTMIKINKKDQDTLSNTNKKSTMTMQVELFQWRPVLSVKGDSCIMRIKGCDQQNLKMSHYMTDEICKRLSNYRVMDKAGVEYALMGKLTDPHNELPDSVKKGFKRGINKFWRNVLFSHYRELTGNCMSFDSQNMSMTVSQLDLTVSKRGRRIIPRLNYWLGERILVRGNETFINRSTAQVVDENRIKEGRNAGKSMSVPSSSTPLTPQFRQIPLDELFVHEFPSEDRQIVTKSPKRMPGKRLMLSQTTMVKVVGSTPCKANNARTPKMEKNKENKEKNGKGATLAGKVMKPKQRI